MIFAITKKCRVLCSLVAWCLRAMQRMQVTQAIRCRCARTRSRDARPPKNIFRRHHRLRVAQADLRKTARTIRRRRQSCVHADQRKIRVVAGTDFLFAMRRCRERGGPAMTVVPPPARRPDRSIAVFGRTAIDSPVRKRLRPRNAAGAGGTGTATRRRISDRLPRAVRHRHPDRAVR